MKQDEALAAIFEELQNTNTQFGKLTDQLEAKEKNIIDKISESQTVLEEVNGNIGQNQNSNSPNAQTAEINIDKIKLVGNEICQQMERQIWSFKNEKVGLFISKKLSLLLIGMVLCSFLFTAASLFMWQKKAYEVEVWKNTAETHFEQYQSLKKKEER